MPTSIVLLIVLLLVNDVWFAWYSMNQRGQATSLIESMKDTYFQHGSAAAAMRLKELRVLLDANVVVALVDMLFTMVGLAGVDIEGFKLFLMFTLWKFAQFGFSVSSSVITTTLWQKYNAAPGDTSAPNLSDKLVKWEVGISAAGLVVELYFLVLICIFANYLRNLKNWRQATGRE
ncbi:hypothetical protein BC828DRAFT_377021 [Blastocladiella britannica]|nr:hypothetical protein BC828DRAFT_377021 [Blastocladiella britannica]